MPLDWVRHGADWPNRHYSRFVGTRGVRWHIQRAGAGPKALLLHGAGASTHSWRGLLPLLVERFDVLALDLPGQGFSAGIAPRFTLPSMAEDIADLLEKEQFSPDVIVGHSAGAAIGLRLITHQDVHPQRMICLNGALSPFEGIQGLIYPSLAKALSLLSLAAPAFSVAARTPGAIQTILTSTGSNIDDVGRQCYLTLLRDPSHLKATLGMMSRWNLEPLAASLTEVTMPVTLAVGLNDRLVPTKNARVLVKHFENANLMEFPGLGHLMHEEDPECISILI